MDAAPRPRHVDPRVTRHGGQRPPRPHPRFPGPCHRQACVESGRLTQEKNTKSASKLLSRNRQRPSPSLSRDLGTQPPRHLEVHQGLETPTMPAARLARRSCAERSLSAVAGRPSPAEDLVPLAGVDAAGQRPMDPILRIRHYHRVATTHVSACQRGDRFPSAAPLTLHGLS